MPIALDRENANADISGITSQEELIEALTSEIDAQEKVVDARLYRRSGYWRRGKWRNTGLPRGAQHADIRL